MVDRQKLLTNIRPWAASDRIRWEFIILAVITAIMYTNPFASYGYNGNVYTDSGLDFVTGRTICGGEIVLTTDVFFILSFYQNNPIWLWWVPRFTQSASASRHSVKADIPDPLH